MDNRTYGFIPTKIKKTDIFTAVVRDVLSVRGYNKGEFVGRDFIGQKIQVQRTINSCGELVWRFFKGITSLDFFTNELNFVEE